MIKVSRAYRRLLLLFLAVPVMVVLMAAIYQAGMTHLEGTPRSFGDSLEWAAETLTTTGYGRDAAWTHPLMQFYVIVTQFLGVLIIFLVFPVFLLPFIEERFEARLPTTLSDMSGRILIYRYGPAITSLLDELVQEGVKTVVFEEDEPIARRLRERGIEVVLGDLGAEDPDLSHLKGARGMVLNGDDNRNAAMALSARYHGYDGPIIALVENPDRRPPMLRAGATKAFTPNHVLAAALATRASRQIGQRAGGVRQLGEHVEVAELRVHTESPLAGKTIEDSQIREDTQSTIVGLWVGGRLIEHPPNETKLVAGTIMVVVGSREAITRLREVATPVTQEGPFLVVGNTDIGSKVTELLRDAGETVRILDTEVAAGTDIVGDYLDHKTLFQAGAREAQALILCLDTDSATLFAAAVARNLVPETIIIAAVRRAENVSRIHRAGADFALSLSQVAGQLLSFHLLGQEAVSLEAEIKLVATGAGNFVGQPLAKHWIRDRTGCSVVAVEREEEVIVGFDPGFEVKHGDVVYLSGTTESVRKYFELFPETRQLQISRLHQDDPHSIATSDPVE